MSDSTSPAPRALPTPGAPSKDTADSLDTPSADIRDRHDVVVIGGGAAGLSAALTLGRAGRRVAVVDGGQPRNAPAAHMHGYLTRDGMSPADLVAVGRAEAARYGAEFVTGDVDHVAPARNPGDIPHFTVHLAGGATLRTRRVIVATGLRDELPDLPGLRERWGQDVLHCPYCHGFEVRDRPLGVLGLAAGAVHHALLIRQWSDDVVYFVHDQEPTPDERERLTARGIRIVPGRVKRLAADGGRLHAVEMDDGTTVAREAVFVQSDMVARDAVLTGLGCTVGPDGLTAVDPTGRTSVDGVWAAGNVVDRRAQVITAAAMGVSAAAAVNFDLVEEEVAAAVCAMRTAGRPAPAVLPPFAPRTPELVPDVAG
ncbi:NAD(P)/FAD-dependent oxidoreductase [Yinghuangia soli]|uniref:NAD(P)/FAD-dependent oxidoreductase n=1 Tax=Yinghuangia soli TaxID=2908204 RepID=A0AA41Q544_9ACTN|nr:NAD(P)/FAD-dependent oxidoreductase [Yinghuangia soli]MCF2530841.1 NAD(P)/FAD-dependent oxidoreductase [Yinghuangia soli]